MQRPPFDPAALVAGVVFSVIAVIGLLDPESSRRLDLAVVWSVTFVAVGLALLGMALRRSTGDLGPPEGRNG